MADNTNKMYKCPEDFQAVADHYFASCAGAPATESTPAVPPTPLTFFGLAYALGFSCLGTLKNYETNAETHEDFNEVAGRACLRVEAFISTQLYNKGVNVAGPIYSLKNRGHSDKSAGEGGTTIIKIDGVTAAIL